MECLYNIGNPLGHHGGPYDKFQVILIPFYKAQSLKREILFLILKGGVLIP